MVAFRGNDAALEREIEALERIARLRLQRATLELRELDRDLHELKAERARRRPTLAAAAAGGTAATA